MFSLDERLRKETVPLGRFPLCRILLMNDATYPWFILVPQLHVHHVVRYQTDPAWPAPIWGHRPAVPYSPERINEIRQLLTATCPELSLLIQATP